MPLWSLCSNINMLVLNNLWLCSRFFQDGQTALIFASQEGRTDVVELLVKHNANINARTEVGLHAHNMTST